ncbi:MAG: hypothetical protein JWP58_335, partial [Hymenobacter sp.]|nr:hypothetical protein [Hymenobacter sp.]
RNIWGAVRQTSKEIMDRLHLSGFNLITKRIPTGRRYFV